LICCTDILIKSKVQLMCDDFTAGESGFRISDELAERFAGLADLSTWGVGILQLWLNGGLDKELLEILDEYYDYLKEKDAH